MTSAAQVQNPPFGSLMRQWRQRRRLSPAATLVVFAVPFIVLFPLKFLEFWFLAHRHWAGAVLTLLVAKLLGLGITAFIFEAARPKLLQMPWFRVFYDWMMWLLARAHALVDPLKRRIRIWLRPG